MKPGQRVVVAAGAPLFALALVFACGPGDLSDLTRGSPLTETPDPPIEGGPPGIPTCKGAVAPDPPPADGDEKFPEILFAVDNMRVDSNSQDAGTELAAPTSFNLDNNCSCEEVDQSCIAPDGGVKTKFCDDKDGRDNVTGGLLADLNSLVPTASPAFLKGRIAAGIFTMFISITDWNGQPNDSRVIVGLRMSAGIDNGFDPALPGERIKPRFDGQDTWSVDPSTILSGPEPDTTPCGPLQCIPQAIDLVHAYVKDGKVVASFAEVNLAFATPGGRLALPYRGVTLVADITMKDGMRRLDGQLAGRWPTDAILNASGAFATPDNPDIDLCKNELSYKFFKDSICRSADLAAQPSDDNKRGVRCGALSEAVRFTAIPAKLGTVRIPDEQGKKCREQLDSCP